MKKKRKLTCIGDGDGKQKEMEEGMLQQQDWQKFGHPHGAGRAGGSHWRRCPGEGILLRLCLKEPVGSELLFIAMS